MDGITAEELRRALSYDQETGIMCWLKAGPGKKRSEAGCKRSDGRVIIRVNRVAYLRSRLAWLWMTGSFPADEIDHADTNPTNDAWSNLRVSTSREQKHNRKVRSDSTSGLKGAHWSARDKSWTARIQVGNRNLYLGTFPTAEQAHAAYACAADRHYGEFARST